MERLPKILLTISLFILDILYSYFIVMGLKSIGIDILSFNTYSKYMALIYIDLSFIFIIFLIYRNTLIKDFTSFFKNFGKNFSIGIKYWIIGLIIMFISNIIIFFISPGGAANEEVVQSTLKVAPVYMIFSTIIFAPIVEELIFRKSIRDFIKNDIIFIIISGLVFGFVHTLAGSSLNELLYIIPYGALGSCFAYMYVKTKNIYTSITFHLIHNAIIVFISLISYWW